jgi:hypothetical protein
MRLASTISMHSPPLKKIGQLRAFASSKKLRQRLAWAQYALFTNTVQIHILA